MALFAVYENTAVVGLGTTEEAAWHSAAEESERAGIVWESARCVEITDADDARRIVDEHTVAGDPLRAYCAGYSDGLEWDLSGYDSAEEVAAETDWATPTINALGPDAATKHFGLAPGSWGGAAWEDACVEYNRGCRAGALAQ